MLNTLNAIAIRLHRFKPFFWLLLVVSMIAFVVLIVTTDTSSDAYTLLAAMFGLWAIGALMITSYFPVEITEFSIDDGFFTRQRKRASYGMAWLAGSIATITSVAIVIMTLKLIGVIVRELSG